MSTQVCESHGEDVVVYQANVPRLQQCPLCAAERKIDVLEEEVASLKNQIYETDTGEDL